MESKRTFSAAFDEIANDGDEDLELSKVFVGGLHRSQHYASVPLLFASLLNRDTNEDGLKLHLSRAGIVKKGGNPKGKLHRMSLTDRSFYQTYTGWPVARVRIRHFCERGGCP